MICCKCGRTIDRTYGRITDLGNYCKACAYQNENAVNQIFQATIEQMEIKAVNEFAEKLKERCHNYYPSIDHYCCSEKAVNVKDIDELLKEFRNDR